MKCPKCQQSDEVVSRMDSPYCLRCGEALPPAPCSPLTVDQVLVALRAMSAQEETTRRVLTGPRDAPDEYSAWYASQVLFEAARLIEANQELSDAPRSE
jgi:hypothetical protein